MQNARWKTWVDTGGTFTDCIAVDEHGTLRRQKVLSNSGLRGAIEEVISPTKMRISATWQAPADFVRGFTFHLLKKAHPERKVVHHDPAESTLAIDRPLPEKASDGDKFEVRSAEEAPILAVQLATGTLADSPLPPMEMRLGTTRGTNALLERRGAPVALLTERFNAACYGHEPSEADVIRRLEHGLEDAGARSERGGS